MDTAADKFTWILASTSPRRNQLLKECLPTFRCISQQTDEIKESTKHSPTWVAEQNALKKAAAVARLHPHAYVLGADTIVVFNNRIFNKPKTLDEAVNMLTTLSGQLHTVTTGVAIVCKGNNFKYTFVEHTQVSFLPLDPTFKKAYLTEISPLDKAGAYAIQHPLSASFIRIKGSFSNVMGLPIEALTKALKQLNLQ